MGKGGGEERREIGNNSPYQFTIHLNGTGEGDKGKGVTTVFSKPRRTQGGEEAKKKKHGGARIHFIASAI